MAPVSTACLAKSPAHRRERKHVYGQFGEDGIATHMVCDGRHKLVYYPVDNCTQLFDLVANPRETGDEEEAWNQMAEQLRSIFSK